MLKCVACRNKKSNDRCDSRAIVGLAFCGQHAKSKNVRVWYEVNHIDDKVTLISKIWRGYAVRNRIKLAGPGVLKRGICHNEEELVLAEPKETVHPFDYFAFEEDGKVWWFDIRSIMSICRTSLIPANPYTRQPLSQEARHRARRIYKYRINNKLPLYHHPFPKMSVMQLIEHQWMKVCQNMHECGFDDITPNAILSLNQTQIFTILCLMIDDLIAIKYTHTNPLKSRYYKYLQILRNDRHNFFSRDYPDLHFAGSIISILNDMTDSFPICFSFASALASL